MNLTGLLVFYLKLTSCKASFGFDSFETVTFDQIYIF